MKRANYLLLLLLAVSIPAFVGAAIPAAASAEKSCTQVDGDACLIVKKGNEQYLETFEHISVESTVASFEVELLGQMVACEKATGTAMALDGAAPQIVKFVDEAKGSCHVVSHPACKVKEPIVMKSLVGTVGLSSEHQAVAISPEAGESSEFLSLVIEGATCELAGTTKVTGSISCEEEFETLAVTQKVVCKKEGSKLKSGTKTVKLGTTLKVSLSGENSGLQWGYALQLF